MSTSFKAACVQVNASDDMAANIEAATSLIHAARDTGADFITTPENVSMMTLGRKNIFAKAQTEDNHPALAAFRALAADLDVWLLAGSLSIKLDEGRLANRSYLLDPTGGIAASYDKIHMFDVDLPSGESYRESNAFRSGENARLVKTPWGLLGMTVCYDIRFPYLYRALAQAGANFFTIPSAFTKVTGRAHWHVLQRARAIEHGCYVIAPAQCGEHFGGRKTYGHSLIVDPWGEVLADGGEEPGITVAEIDPARVDAARRMVPTLDHDRDFQAPEPVADSLRAIG
jgi:predicted amidohydrolase